MSPPQPTILYLRTRHGSYPSTSSEHGMAGMIEMKTTAAGARLNAAAAAEGNSQEAEEDCVDFREDSHWSWRKTFSRRQSDIFG